MLKFFFPATALFALLAAACGASGAGGRQVQIVQRDSGCTPASVSASPGEKLQFVVKNEAGSDYEVEGIEGTKVDEVIVPKGKTRKVGYNVPAGGGTQKIKCYVPAGPSTIIEVVAGGATPATSATPAGAASPASGTPAALRQPDATVAVTLTEFSVTPSVTSATAGVIRFVATNTGGLVHEFAVLRVNDDGSRGPVDEIEDIAPGAGDSLTVDLTPGTYELACLLVPGEFGSTVDHYKQGMHATFTIE